MYNVHVLQYGREFTIAEAQQNIRHNKTLESYIAEAQLIKATREEDLAKAKEETANSEAIQPEAEIDLPKQQTAVYM